MVDLLAHVLSSFTGHVDGPPGSAFALFASAADHSSSGSRNQPKHSNRPHVYDSNKFSDFNNSGGCNLPHRLHSRANDDSAHRSSNKLD